ncbi:hypothetical protein OROMI_022680 [Orobanche minor]
MKETNCLSSHLQSPAKSKISDQSIIDEELLSIKSSMESDILKTSDQSVMEEERLSVKSSTEEEEESYIIKSGSKRKVDFEAEEDSNEYESDESEDDDDEEDSDDLMSSETVEVLGSDGVPLTDKDILGWMVGDFRPLPEKIKLLPKIRRYLKSIEDSEGFEISDYPGYIWTVSSLRSGQSIIDKRERHPEGYNHLVYMCSLAIKFYNGKNNTGFMVKDVEKVTFYESMGTNYNLTFNATWDETTRTFQANVWDNTVDVEVEVGLCRLKPSPSSTKEELLSAYNSRDELSDKWTKEDPSDICIAGNDKSDLLTRISDLIGYSNTKMLNVIKSDHRTANKDIVKLMTKVRTYLRSILQSEGFKCSDFPGHISDVTILIPRQKIIDQAGCCLECYYHVRLMAKLAFDCYVKDNYTDASKCQLGHVQTVNLWKETDCCYTYYVTFDVFTKEPGDFNEQTFEAKVQDIKHSIKVIFCRKAASRCRI